MTNAKYWQWIIYFFLFACFAATSAPYKAETRENMHGIYVLPTGGKGIDSQAATADFVTGYSIRIAWKVLEPKEGHYNWQPIDKIIELARENGKYVTLRILAGFFSPKWVMNDPTVPKLEFISRNPNKETYFNKTVRLPRPWDINYLKKYYLFLEALAKRYASEPLLYWVAVSGPVMGPATPHLPTHPESIKALERQGFTKERWRKVWEEAIDRTAIAFPEKSISLCLDVPPFYPKLADHLTAYAVGKYGRRMSLQSNGLSAKIFKVAERNSKINHFLNIFKEYNGKANTGFQMTWAAAWKHKGRDRLGPLHQAIDNGLQLGARYLEIYQDDIINPANAAILADASQKLGAVAGTTTKESVEEDEPTSIAATSMLHEVKARKSMQGIYVLQTGGKGIDPQAAGADFVTGYSIRFAWKVIEPQEKRYNWQPIDKIIELAKKNGKYVTLRILAGIYSPEWVVNDARIPKLQFVNRDPNQIAYYNKTVSIPKPWDDNYLGKWYSFLEALGKRYRNEPLLYWVTVSGPVLGSAVPTMPGHPETIEAIKRQGYTRERWIEVWKEAIDRTASAFPKSAISLALDPPPFDVSIADELAAYTVSKYGKRVCLQSNGLSAKILRVAKQKAVVEHFLNIFPKYADKATIGFQMTWAAAWKHKSRRDRLGPLDQAIENGLQLGARYLEIYQDDIIDPANAAILTDASKKLGAVAGPTAKESVEEDEPTSIAPSLSPRIDLRSILSQLNLTNEQKQEVRKILWKGKLEKKAGKSQNEMRQNIINQIRGVLTEDQRSEFDQLLSER